MPPIDFQTLILPDTVSDVLPPAARKWGKFWANPISRALHEAQPWIRFLPPIGRSIVEELSSIAPLAHTLFESSLSDLRESAAKNRIDRCVILSDPTRVPNDRLLEIAERDPMFIPAIRIPRVEGNFEGRIEKEIADAHARGCRILSVHPASDGVVPSDPFYLHQVAVASVRNWIVLIQTGAPKAHLVYRRPEFSEIARFEEWFKAYPKTPFVIARMGFNEPERAMDLAEMYPNLILETSWQPTETIAEAVRRVGAGRVVFGSDWPILGNNQRVGLHRIRDAVDSQMFTEADSARILGENAAELLGAALNQGEKI
jgi:predicted TIM-barrel fold metal-dependent hydrolase